MYAIRSYYADQGDAEFCLFQHLNVIVAIAHSRTMDAAQSVDVGGFFSRMVIAFQHHDSDVNRITSYNVCYTKLLRRR